MIFLERMKWKGQTNEQIIQYGKDNGLHGLSPIEVLSRDESYYNLVYRKGLAGVVFKCSNSTVFKQW